MIAQVPRASCRYRSSLPFFFCQAEDGIRDIGVTGVQTCALPILFRLGKLATGVFLIRLHDVPTDVRASLVGAVVREHESELRGAFAVLSPTKLRSEERRVGKGCRSWWSPYH